MPAQPQKHVQVTLSFHSLLLHSMPAQPQKLVQAFHSLLLQSPAGTSFFLHNRIGSGIHLLVKMLHSWLLQTLAGKLSQHG
jgi:hypothetical protein